MLDDELYLSNGEELSRLHMVARQLLHAYNISLPAEEDKRREIMRNLFGKLGDNFVIRPPFYCDYGCHIFAGDRLFINYDCTILDCNEVHIGNDVLFGPKVQIYTAYHPTDPALRLTGQEQAAPILIGNNVWIGGGVIVCPGVSIGSNVTIGAGSVVTKDIPNNVVAVGNPCRVVKTV